MPIKELLIKEHLIIIRDKKGDLVQIFRNDKPPTEEDIVKCLEDTKGETAWVDITYRLKE